MSSPFVQTAEVLLFFFFFFFAVRRGGPPLVSSGGYLFCSVPGKRRLLVQCGAIRCGGVSTRCWTLARLAAAAAAPTTLLVAAKWMHPGPCVLFLQSSNSCGSTIGLVSGDSRSRLLHNLQTQGCAALRNKALVAFSLVSRPALTSFNKVFSAWIHTATCVIRRRFFSGGDFFELLLH